MLKQNTKYLNRIFVLADAVIVSLALFLAWYLRIESGVFEQEPWTLPFGNYMLPLIFLVPMYLFLHNFFGLYTPYRSRSLYDEFINLFKANSIGVLVFFVYLFIYRIVDYSRLVLVLFYFLSMVLAFGERIALRLFLRNLRRKRKNLRHIVMVGFSDLAKEYSKRLKQNRHWGYNVLGVFDDDSNRDYLHLYKETVKRLGTYSELDEFLQYNSVDEVVITMELREYEKLTAVVNTCEKNGVYTRIIPDYYKVIPAKPYVEDIDGLPIITTRNIPLNDLVRRTFKRAVDIVASLAGMVILSPFFLVIAALIRLDSPGNIFFGQVRVGLNKKEFKMYKFRSMRLQTEEEERKCWTTENDPRVTRIGKFIRKTSIDEFPQLWNVLKGDMSLIGPRPERPQYVEQFREEIPKYMVKHQVRPGMTGWAQIHGLRGDTSIEKRIEYDLYYIENWTVALDIKILFMTVFKGFINSNAY